MGQDNKNGPGIPIIGRDEGGSRGPKGVLVPDVPPEYDPQSAGQPDAAGSAGPKHEPSIYSADPLCNPELVKKGQQLLGNYLLGYFERQIRSSPVKPQAEEFLKRIGPFVLQFGPLYSLNNRNNISLVKSISTDLVSVLLNIEGGVTLDGKLVSNDEDCLKIMFPEISVGSVLTEERRLEIFSPFQYVMSLNPDYRALCAVAVKKGLEEKCLIEYNSEQTKATMLADCPHFRHFASACQENSVSLERLHEILQEFRRVHKLYDEQLK